MLGNDGNWRKQGMEELAGPIAAWLCGCPFLLRSKACCGKEALDLHSIDGGEGGLGLMMDKVVWYLI